MPKMKIGRRAAVAVGGGFLLAGVERLHLCNQRITGGDINGAGKVVIASRAVGMGGDGGPKCGAGAFMAWVQGDGGGKGMARRVKALGGEEGATQFQHEASQKAIGQRVERIEQQRDWRLFGGGAGAGAGAGRLHLGQLGKQAGVTGKPFQLGQDRARGRHRIARLQRGLGRLDRVIDRCAHCAKFLKTMGVDPILSTGWFHGMGFPPVAKRVHTVAFFSLDRLCHLWLAKGVSSGESGESPVPKEQPPR